MMKILNCINLALRSPKVPADSKAREEQAVRGVVAAHSHGNLRLQRGQYYMREDVEKGRKKIARADFSPT